MADFFGYTLLAQAISTIMLGLLMLHFAREYQRKYLFYWSYSFISLAIYLSTVYISLVLLADLDMTTSVLKLSNLLIMLTAGYLQIAFLVVGTLSLVNGTQISKRTILWLFLSCLIIALTITLYKNWTPTDVNLRYLTRVGLRYLTAGIACLYTAIYILRKDPNPLFGKKLVTIGFFVYGFEMAFLGWLTVENYLFDGSTLLPILVPYHGLFELLMYPLIGISLVMWLLDVERMRVQQSSEKLMNLNHTDGLTGLPNQAALQKHLSVWKQNARTGERLTLALIGVDKMQRINDAEGIKKGDELMVQLAKRLEFLCTGRYRFFGRLHSDVFVVILNGGDKTQTNKTEKLRHSLSRPFKQEGKTYHLEMSAGITKISNQLKISFVLHQANQALQAAKQSGGKKSVHYHEGINATFNPDLTLENEVRVAIKLNQLELYFQPIWSAHNRIICFESLVRWNHPDRGLLRPDSFLFMMQSLGMMIALDHWVIQQSIKQVRAWKYTNPGAARITINVSAETIQNGDVVKFIQDCLTREQVDAEAITLEVTENTAMHNIESGRDTLSRLQQLGIQIAIDDFGTGYSSLNYLKTFPADVIKFDRSFVSDSRNQTINEEILKALIPLCHRLGKKVVVEGIENKQQFELLKTMTVSGFQGYYLSHPVHSDAAKKLLVMSRKSQVAKG
ncbi:putative bifunctional diguanylate cyclase/phosphodiesterase [Marinicella sediminis]|uniref:Bifunctional diguanylate cyclase/phosphodiesterase n=1 Tax=Marinicella sediminis TaxID=1792834 RepID=A0ABV7J484_9GAMM|nr:bifunctional diguanylate cyclase/phosphodiesterase [Marinicella sediminis]